MKFIYPAIFTPFEEGSGYSVVVPDLPGCVSQGNDLIEAIEMGTDAASGWILGELEEGNQFPGPSPQADIELEGDSFINLLVLDIDAYSEKYGSQTVRKNITIPAWLNTYGEKNHINFSKLLADALMKQAAN
ncbi:MAG: HicB family protein [Lachnospiraceae bacterium]|nr:HicB family protein [Lachnospiraceae bacterium]